MDFRSLGEAIREARTARHWSQAELGRRIYRSQSRISEIESGLASVPLEDLVRIGDVLDSHAVDCALAAAVTHGRLGLVASVRGGVPGALMALEWEMRDLLAAIERVRMSLLRVTEAPGQEALAALRCDIRDIVVLAHAMEIECDQITPMSARELARQYSETRRHYAVQKQNRLRQQAA